MPAMRNSHPLPGVSALFDYSIDGDAGNDPNFMSLWLSQADLGLPSKVGRSLATPCVN